MRGTGTSSSFQDHFSCGLYPAFWTSGVHLSLITRVQRFTSDSARTDILHEGQSARIGRPQNFSKTWKFFLTPKDTETQNYPPRVIARLFPPCGCRPSHAKRTVAWFCHKVPSAVSNSQFRPPICHSSPRNLIPSVSCTVIWHAPFRLQQTDTWKERIHIVFCWNTLLCLGMSTSDLDSRLEIECTLKNVHNWISLKQMYQANFNPQRTRLHGKSFRGFFRATKASAGPSGTLIQVMKTTWTSSPRVRINRLVYARSFSTVWSSDLNVNTCTSHELPSCAHTAVRFFTLCWWLQWHVTVDSHKTLSDRQARFHNASTNSQRA